MFAGMGAQVGLIDNDSDPDGDALAVCRIGPEKHKGVRLVLFPQEREGGAVVLSRPSTKPGTYTFTYYACDYETLVPGTLTVTVEPRPDIAVKALPGRPGKIKVTNPADFKIEFLFGSAKEDKPDGVVGSPRGSSAVIEVRRTEIIWVAFKSRTLEFIDIGRVRNIKLPPGTTPPSPADRVDRSLARLWMSRV